MEKEIAIQWLSLNNLPPKGKIWFLNIFMHLVIMTKRTSKTVHYIPKVFICTKG